ncbi:mediator of RNA polymerase II transcription subunit 34-like [Paramuricea clavata]|uniref:DNA 3'-5' helicase n=1 Tax=Paramuricea clavata TaxID=317549 RepID=A0A6S7FLM1_PARCT|nr:mediator of RNA polymerase II transcription subunit 34-like [Paramuricea clavata]
MEFDEAVSNVCELFRINKLSDFQYNAIKKITEKKNDVFINMPTGSGKSLTYQALPIVFDCLSEGSPRCEYQPKTNILIVVSPLVSLMKDQVDRLNALGIKAISLSLISSANEENDLLNGRYSIVYGSPESWLLNEKWRSMLLSNSYSNKICAVAVDEAHIIKHWGKSSSNRHAAFRECFIKLGELRSLVPTTFVVLTATATEKTKQEIFEVLLMADPYVITESPNKLNITYYVSYINKYDQLNELFKWLTDELLERGVDCTRTIIYCQTITQCSTLYAVLRESLGERNVLDQNNKCMVLIEMLHSCTPEANKREILSSFQKVDGSIRVLVATISFGMGVDSKGVTNVVHFGPSKNVESYIQETGRAGRGGTHGNAFLLYSSLLLRHVDKDMKSYVKTECCRREFLLSFFEPARYIKHAKSSRDT